MPIGQRIITITSGLLAATIGGNRTRLTFCLLLGTNRFQHNGRNWVVSGLTAKFGNPDKADFPKKFHLRTFGVVGLTIYFAAFDIFLHARKVH